jgi:hypothetical protein
MTAFAPAAAPSIASPFQDTAQTRATAKSINNALNRFESAGNILDIARDFTKELSNIWKLGKPESQANLPDGMIGALGLYAKVFKLGLDIAFGAEPSQALKNSFTEAMKSLGVPTNDLDKANMPSTYKRPWQ